MPNSPSTTCPNCGADASGKFCSNCGAVLKGVKCPQCQADLAPGAKFCHKCGAAVGAGAAAARPAAKAKSAARADAPASPAANSFAAMAPWAVAGIALVALIALVFTYQFKGGGDSSGDQQATGPFAGGGGTGSPSNVDISSMSPRERAERLYNRIMRLNTEGKQDSVSFFAPMAIGAYQMIPDQDADTRYDLGRIAELAKQYPVALAQVDTILAVSPDNLLGLTLGMRVNRDIGNKKAAASFGKRLIAAAPAERKRDFEGYKLHATDLDEALKEAASP